MTPERIGIDTEALGEMYDALGVIARDVEIAVDAVRPAVDDVVALDDLPAILREVLRRLERIHAVAAAERERWYRA